MQARTQGKGQSNEKKKKKKSGEMISLSSEPNRMIPVRWMILKMIEIDLREKERDR